MDAAAFKNSPSGVLVPIEGGQVAFLPNPLPPSPLDMARLVPHLTRAERILGELNGIGRTLDNPFLLIRPLQYQEAITSSAMEGTYTTLDDLLQIEAGDEHNIGAETREVRNYRKALSDALANLKTLPLSLRLLQDAHRTLLTGVTRQRGANVRPGEFKQYQNFIGSSAQKARFVPPPPQAALEALHALERYFHTEPHERLPDLIDAALVHYQFETIHPFADGNGRVGRMLIVLHLIERGVLREPLLYLSPVLEQRKDTYIDAMFEVSRTGAWEAWIIFFLEMVEAAARHAVHVSDALHALKNDYRQRIQHRGGSSRLLEVVDVLFTQPAITIPQVAQHLKITYRAASLIINRLVTEKIVAEVSRPVAPKIFLATEIRDIIQKTVSAHA